MKEQCQCYDVIHPDNPHKCTLCNRNFSACLYINELQHKITIQAIEIEQLKSDLVTSENEVRRQGVDLETLNTKYIAGLDRIADIQQQKELADREMEELSARLFEEANNMVAIEKREKHQLEELLRYTEDQLNTEKSQLFELRNRIQTTAIPPPVFLEEDTRNPVAQIMRLYNENRLDNGKLRSASETIKYDSNTRRLFEDIKAQQNALLHCPSKMNKTKQSDESLFVKNNYNYDQMPHPSDSAYFSTVATISNCSYEESISDITNSKGIQHFCFQNFIQEQQKSRSNSMPSLISDVSSGYSSRRGSADDEEDRIYSIFQLNSSSTVLTGQPSTDFVARVEIEDIEPCLQFGSSNSRMCTKTIMEHMRSAPCFIEPVSLKEAKNLPSTTNAISSAYYRPIWERLTISSIPSQHLECSACGNKCRITTNEVKHNKSYYRFRLLEKEDWLLIDQNCRDRLVAVCEFYNFIRNIRMGHYKQRSLHDLYLENVKLRLNIFYSRS